MEDGVLMEDGRGKMEDVIESTPYFYIHILHFTSHILHPLKR